VKYLLLLAIVVSGFLGCSQIPLADHQRITGIIRVVGNEPFAKLAVITTDGLVYRIKPSASLEGRMLAAQGHQVSVLLGKPDLSSGDAVYIVEDVDFQSTDAGSQK
jgi:hypothetical protein